MDAINSVPGNITISAGFLSANDHARMFNALKNDASSQNLLGNRKNTLFTQGKGAILKFQDAATERAFNKNAPYYGLDVEGAFVHPVGERQKNRRPNRDDLFALMNNFRHYNNDFSPEKDKRNENVDAQPKQYGHVEHPSGAGGTYPQDADIRELIIESEGYKDVVYRDTKGHLTGGIGHLLQKRDNDPDSPTYGQMLDPIVYKRGDTPWEEGDSIREELIEEWYQEDLEKMRAGASFLDNWERFPTELQNLLIDFVFNIGANAFGHTASYDSSVEGPAWPKMTAALNEGRWADAREEVFDDWDNVQVSRLERLLNALDGFIDSQTNRPRGR